MFSMVLSVVDFCWVYSFIHYMNDPKPNDVYALLIAEIPLNERGEPSLSKWDDFSGRVQRLSTPTEGMTKLADNVWQIRLNPGILLLSDIVHAAFEAKVKINTLILTHEPQWTKSTEFVKK